MSRFIGVTASNDQHAYDARCDELNDEFEDERTETMTGSPPSPSARYIALFDAAAETTPWLDVLECSNPGIASAFLDWAGSRELEVTAVRGGYSSTVIVSYSVAVNAGRICVFVAERG